MGQNGNKRKIKVRQKDSSLGEFVMRPLPSDSEVQKFKEKVKKEYKKEKEENIKSGLSEIYHDEKGNEVDVKKIIKKKKHGIIFLFFNFLFFVFFLAGIGAGFFYYFYDTPKKDTELSFYIEGEKEMYANQEFFYKIKYTNNANFSLNNFKIFADYPDNFIFLESFPPVGGKEGENDFWEIGQILPNGEGSVKIKGKIIDKKDESAVFLSKINYTPSNFSSEFNREESYNANLGSIGFDSEINFPDSVLVGENENLSVKLKQNIDNYLDDFILEINKDENVKISGLNINVDDEENENEILNIEELGFDSWKIKFLEQNELDLNLDFVIDEKLGEKQDLNFIFKKIEGENTYVFDEKSISLEVIKSNLDLNVIINGSQKNESVNFGDRLNYSISYANKGEAAMENLTIMAVIESQSVDWTTLEDGNNGTEKGNTITWTFNEIPKLENLEVGQEGVLNFSLNVLPFIFNELDKAFEIKSYAQFITGDDQTLDNISATSTTDNKSNMIVNKINSDLRLLEEIRYFNEDNIPVGTGPLPPKVDEETTFKVYWTLENNLHELKDLKVIYKLPENVTWGEKNRTSVGTVYFNPENKEIVWDVGRLPLAIYKASAEFNISLTPGEGDQNKILVISNGSEVRAVDVKNESDIFNKIKAKTTKLEDDEIAGESSDGRVEK
ncbi:hypothetical protein K8R62_00810 [bacterium]|nr:hypothetical protein [bacterium]